MTDEREEAFRGGVELSSTKRPSPLEYLRGLSREEIEEQLEEAQKKLTILHGEIAALEHLLTVIDLRDGRIKPPTKQEEAGTEPEVSEPAEPATLPLTPMGEVKVSSRAKVTKFSKTLPDPDPTKKKFRSTGNEPTRRSEIWHYLDRVGPKKPTEIGRDLEIPAATVYGILSQGAGKDFRRVVGERWERWGEPLELPPQLAGKGGKAKGK